MATIRFSGFQGANKAVEPSLLPDTSGTMSVNQKPGRGDLRPWREPTLVKTLPAGDRTTIYRMGRETASDSEAWLSWTNDVHVVRGANASDNAERTFYTGDDYPKWTDNTIFGGTGTDRPVAFKDMRLPAPATPPVVSFTNPADTFNDVETTNEISSAVRVAGGFADVTTLTDHGITNGQTVTITINYLLSNTTTPASGTFTVPAYTIDSYTFRVAYDVAAEFTYCTGTVTYTKSTLVELDEETRSYVYTYVTTSGYESGPSQPSNEIVFKTGAAITVASLASPPAGTHDIAVVRIYRTQAGTDSANYYFVKDVAVGTASTADAVATVQEVLPSATWLPIPDDAHHLTEMWNGMMACIVGRSVRICEPGIPTAWPLDYEILPTDVTPVALGTFGQMLVVLTNANPLLVGGASPDAMDQQKVAFLQSCVSTKSVVSMGHGVAWASPDGLAYIGSDGPRLLTEGILTKDDWAALNPSSIKGVMYDRRYFGFYGTNQAFILDPNNPNGIYFLNLGADAVYVDDLQDSLYILQGADIKKWDAGNPMTATYTSKVFRLPKPIPSFACAEVAAGSYPVTFELYADGVLKHTEEVQGPNPFRLPSGYHAQKWQIVVATTGSIQSVGVAHSIRELAEV